MRPAPSSPPSSPRRRAVEVAGWLWRAAVPLVICAHVFATPFTKVEESFNVQAVYDLLHKPWWRTDGRALFDHFEFPGVVPRTFVGPLLLSLPTFLFSTLFESATVLHVFRLLLGLCSALSLESVRRALAHRFSSVPAAFFVLLFVAQFHLPFYASRPLPNVLALCLTNWSLSARLSVPTRPRRAIVLLSVAVALLRSELSLLLFPTVLSVVVHDAQSLFPTCLLALASASVVAVLSIVVDSLFWGRLCYPELEVFYFNAILNKSSAWGVSPYHWYWSNALPRALGLALPLALIGVLQSRRLLAILAPYVFFVLVYSLLPHKELRFIFYVIPPFNVAASIAVANAIRHIRPSKPRLRSSLFSFAVLVLALLAVLASAAQTAVSVAASRLNYPSAHALQWLHDTQTPLMRRVDINPYVHIDAHSAMTGVSQFLYHDSRLWRYSKEEHLSDQQLLQFTHLLSERRSVPGFRLLHAQQAFVAVNWRARRLDLTDHTFVHRRVDVADPNDRPE